MGNETAYEPLKGGEGGEGDDAEAGTTTSAPRWARRITGRQSSDKVQQYLPILRIVLEVVLVFAVFLLSLKVFIDRDEGPCRLPMGPNDPVKNCTSAEHYDSFEEGQLSLTWRQLATLTQSS
jgi:hypothetical protein